MLAELQRKAFYVSDDPRLPPREVLLALNRSVTAARLMAGAIHEVNNALQVISGTVEILQGRTDLPEPVTRALDRLRKQGTRAGTALADVLVFTKGAVDETARVDMREVVEYCVGVRRFAIQRGGLTVRWEPDPHATYAVMGIRSLLQQAVLNLIINAEQALAFTRGNIAVELADTDDWVEVQVADNGPGVVVEPRERAFDPFVTTRHPWQGSGLGLWAARAIAEAHHGTVTMQPGATGVAFVLRLPKEVEK
jgi:signal transduction histidine kinase